MGFSEVCAYGASEVTPCGAVKYCGFAPFPKTRFARFGDPEGCRKVKLSVPHIVATPHFTREAHFTSEGHFTFRVSGTLS